MQKIMYLTEHRSKQKGLQYRFLPSPAMRKAGFISEVIGPDYDEAAAKVLRFTAEFEEMKAGVTKPRGHEKLVSSVIHAFEKDVEFYGSKKPATKAEIDYCFRVINAEYGSEPIDAIKRRHVRLFYNNLVDTHSLNLGYRVLKYLRRLFKFAIELELIEANPASELGLTKPPARTQTWEPHEVHTVISLALKGWEFKTKRNAIRKVIARPSVALATAIAYDTSLPMQDILALTWDKFDGEKLTLFQIKPRGKVRLCIPLSPLSLNLVAKMDKPKGGHLILNEGTGKPYPDKNAFGRHFRKFRVEAGVIGRTFHDIRRTVLTELGNTGATNVEISAYSGHAPNSPMLAVYVTPGEEAADRAFEKRKAAKPKLASVN